MKRSSIKRILLFLLISMFVFSVAYAVDLTMYWSTGNIGIVQDIVVADINMDGFKETIVGMEIGYGSTSLIRIYDGISQTLEDEIWLPLGYPNQIEAEDVDNDGIVELIVGSGSWVELGGQGYVYVYDGQTYALEWESENVGSISSLHVADFDLDGTKEIFVGVWKEPTLQDYGRTIIFDGITHAIEYDAFLPTHFTFAERSTVCNLDGDPALEIVYGAIDYNVTQSSNVYVLDGITHELENVWGEAGFFRTATVGDVDGDGLDEYIIGHAYGLSVGDAKQIKVYDADWLEKWSYTLPPQPFYGVGPIALGDVDGDQIDEIVAGVADNTWSGYICIIDGQSQSLIWQRDGVHIPETSCFGDVNNDSRPELCIGYAQSTSSGYMEIFLIDTPVLVNLDIKPGSCPNALNVKPYQTQALAADNTFAKLISDVDRRPKAVISVAILGTADFDVSQIDPSTLLLEGVPILRWSLEDVGTPVGPDAEECECNDLDGDGYMDLTLKFDKEAIVNALGEVYDGDIIALTITGQLYDGTEIEGTDCVLIRAKDEMADIFARSSEMPETFSLGQNYPNPFNPETEISYNIPEACNVTLDIYNIKGQKVATLVEGYKDAGSYIVKWNSRGANGHQVASGIYFYRLTAGELTKTMKMVLMK